jgi:rRNA maturation protein Nop10
MTKEHRCDEFKSALASKFSKNEDWIIMGKKLTVRGEYTIRIDYCPFCGVEL